MSFEAGFDIALSLVVAVTAFCAVTGRDMLRSIAFYIAYGVMIALCWLRLGSVDVALAEAAIGAGLTGVLLIGAWSMVRRLSPHSSSGPAPLIFRIGAGAVSAGIAATLIHAISELPVDGGLTGEVARNLAGSGIGNPVTGVLLNFRAYDTLLESVVLLVALVAVWALTPRDMWGGPPGLRQHARKDGVMAIFGRVLPPLGLVVGVYLVWAGSAAPGGAFQGGTVLAAVLLLAVMAGAIDMPPVSSPALRSVLVAGPVTFLAVGTAGLFGPGFLAYPQGWDYALILAIEYALTVSIAATLALLVAGTPGRRA